MDQFYLLFMFQEDKKKRDKDRGENEGERDLKCSTPVQLELSHEKPLASSLAKQEGNRNDFKNSVMCVYSEVNPMEFSGSSVGLLKADNKITARNTNITARVSIKACFGLKQK